MTQSFVNRSGCGPGRLWVGFLVGASVGLLGGLIGLGGAEFRLPLLIGLFGFMALQAIILNKAMSLIVVAAALPARLLGVPLEDVVAELHVIINLFAGSLLGAWLGATWATRMASATLYRVIAALLVLSRSRLPLTTSEPYHRSTSRQVRRWPLGSRRAWRSGSSRH